MLRSSLVLAAGLALALPALSTATAEPVDDLKAAEGEAEVSDEEALEDDILFVIDLPIVAADAHDAGVETEEIDEVLTTAADADLPARATTEILTAEIETTKTKGKRKGFHRFVRKQLAAGTSPKEIAEKIRDREQMLEEMSDEERAALEKRIAELRDHHKRHKEAVKAKRKDLKAKGKVIKILAKAAHEARKAELKEKREELREARKTHREARGEHKEAREDAKEAREDRKEAVEALKAAETPEERKAAAEALRDAKAEHKEAKKEKKEAKKEKHEAKKEKHEAKKEKKEAKKDVKKGHPKGKGHKGAGKKKGKG